PTPRRSGAATASPDRSTAAPPAVLLRRAVPAAPACLAARLRREGLARRACPAGRAAPDVPGDRACRAVPPVRADLRMLCLPLQCTSLSDAAWRFAAKRHARVQHLPARSGPRKGVRFKTCARHVQEKISEHAACSPDGAERHPGLDADPGFRCAQSGLRLL